MITSYTRQGDAVKPAQIAIIGIGCWYPGARNPKQLWENILGRRRQFRRMPAVRLPLAEYQDDDTNVPDKTYGVRAAVIDGYAFDWAKHRIPQSAYDSTDIVHWLALDVALQMLEDAHYKAHDLPRETTQVVVGNTLTGEFTRANMLRLRWPFVNKALHASALELGMSAEAVEVLSKTLEQNFKSGFAPINEDTLAGGLANTIAGRICNYLNLNGGGYTVDGACSSSLIAVHAAATSLADGITDFAIAGGVDISLDPFELVGFAKTGALTPSDMAVYDKRGNGFIPGEGCGFIGLKRLADAQRDGDKIYAVLDGWGMSSDGKGGLTAPSVKGQALALRRAYTQAGIDPSALDFIEGHGTGTTVGDRTELLAITRILEESRTMSKRRCGVTSLKSIIGHTKAAAGIGALIKATIAVNQRVIPPTAGCELPHDVFSGESTCLYPVVWGEKLPADKVLRAGVSAMGFGGINLHVTLTSGGQPVPDLKPEVGERAAMASHQDSELFCFSAANFPELMTWVHKVQADAVGASVAELTDLAAWLNTENDPNLPIKAAVLAHAPDELARKLTLLLGHLEAPPLCGHMLLDRDNALVIGNQVETCAFGYIFPGQGSQRINMARGLVERFAWARALVDDADRWAAQLGTDHLAACMYPNANRMVSKEEREEASERLRHTQLAQPAIVLASLLWLKYLRRLGLTADIALGHSLGELTAFYAVGAFDEQALIQLATLRGQLMAGSEQASTGGMLSLACDRPHAEDLIAKVRGQGLLVVANINSPSQTVVSGDMLAIDALQQVAAQYDVRAHRLAVSNAFHSPLVATAATQIRERAPIPRSPQAIQGMLISSCDGSAIADDVDLHEHFAQQILCPVDFISAVKHLSNHCDVVFEVGPGNTLSNLIAQAAGRGNLVAFPVERQAESCHDLNWLIGLAHVYGKPIQWQEVYANRIVRPFVSAHQLEFLVNPCERQVISRELGNSASTAGEALSWMPSALSLERRPGSPAPIRQGNSAALDGATPSAMPEEPKARVVAAQSSRTVSPLPAEDVLLDLVAQHTGFNRATLQPTFFFVDDLNLDSIKIAALIAQAEAKLGLEGGFDLSQVANATIGEIAAKMQARVSHGSTIGDLAPQALWHHETATHNWVRSFVMHLVPSALDTKHGESPDYKNRVVAIQCDQSEQELAAALRDRLSRLGATVMIMDSTRLLQETRTDITHFMIILPKAVASATSGQERLARAISRLRAAAVASTRQAHDVSVSYVQFGGISEGADLADGTFATSCASSFAASLHLERPGLSVRVVDFHPDHATDFIAERIMAEQVGSERYVLSHYCASQQRYVLEPKVIEAQLQASRAMCWSAEDVVVVTGGAKGITAACALSFAKATGARMVLVGSSPYDADEGEPAGEIGQTLSRYAEAGLFARYRQCDLVDADAVKHLIKDVMEEIGPVSAVIHGAGVNRPCRVEQVTEEEAFREVAPKVQGILNLCGALEAKPPKLIVGLSSIIGITGMPGNAWYAFSNEALHMCLQEFRRTHPTTQTVALAYSVWGEIGMGARMGSIQHLAQMGVSAIPAEAGVAHFMHAVMGESAAHLVIIASRLGGLDTWRRPESPTPAANRFLQEIRDYEPGVALVAQTRLTLEDDLYLRDHYYRGVYLFPTVFGLEAMAQAVAKVLGIEQFNSLKIIDISLTRPIVVGSGSGTEIQVTAEVVERQTALEPVSVRVGIATAQTGFTHDHFSATFVLEEQPIEVGMENDIVLPESYVEIEPKTELYGGLLFQGPLFQRLQRVWSMDSSGSVITIERQAAASYFSSNHSGVLILGDPAFRDVLLQSAQLSVKGTLLPVGIDALYLYSVHGSAPSLALAQNRLTSHTDDGPICTVMAVRQDDHSAIERLVGYRLKQMEYDEAGPEPEDWANPGKRDAHILGEGLRASGEGLGVEIPEYTLTFLPQLAKMDQCRRRARQSSLLLNVATNAVAIGAARLPEAIEIQWLGDGKPVVRGLMEEKVGVSLSYDTSHCLCVAGEGVQGCNLEPIHARSEQEWQQLLHHKWAALLQELVDSGDSLNEAGTRIWCALESVKKAMGDARELQSLRRQGKSVLFSCTTASGTVSVLTCTVSVTRPPQKMVAMLVHAVAPQVEAPQPSQPSPARPQGRDILADQAYTYVQAGPMGQPEFCHRFRVTFKDTTTLRHGLSFDIFANWMGSVRELATAGIAKELVADFASGRWGMVTNGSNIHVVGEARCLDLIEGRMHIRRVYGKFDSCIDMHFEWIKIHKDNSEEIVALSDIAMTWVAIRGHGIVEVRPFPNYMRELIHSYLPYSQQHLGRDSQAAHKRQYTGPIVDPEAAFGACLYLAPKAPCIEPELMSCTFETSLAESNLVGNIYYANYYRWQRQVIDRFFYNVSPELCTAGEQAGAFWCVRSSVTHLKEAMPFDQIEVAMGLKGLYRKGIQLHFDFYKIAADGLRMKLAVGAYEAVWVADAQSSRACDLPDCYLTVLRERLPVAVANP